MEKEKKLRNEDGSYIFPNIMASAMRKVNPRVQYEAALLSLTIILCSLVFIGIFTIIFTDYSLTTKIMTGINTVALFIFLSSNLVTTYQQYFQFMSFSGILNNEKTKNEVIGFNDELDSIKKQSKELKNQEEEQSTISEQIKKDILSDDDMNKVIKEIKNLNKQLNDIELY
jgi:hypothetical protein